MKNTEVLNKMGEANNLLKEFSQILGEYMVAQFESRQSPVANEHFKQIFFHVAELEMAMGEMLFDMQAAVNVEEATNKVLKKAQIQAQDPDLPF